MRIHHCIAVAAISWHCVAANSVNGQPLFRHLESLESVIVDSDRIAVGKITDIQGNRNSTIAIATFAIEQVIKGDVQQTLQVTVNPPNSGLDRWRAESTKILVATNSNVPPHTTLIDLGKSDRSFEFMTADYTIIREADSLIDAAKIITAQSIGTKSSGRFGLIVPREAVTNTAWMQYYGSGGYVILEVPIDSRLENRAISLIRDENYLHRMNGVEALGHFKSDENIVRLKSLLTDRGYSHSSAEQNEGIETRDYGVRRRALEILERWGLSVEKPIVMENVSMPEKVTSSNIETTTDGDLADTWLAKVAMFPNLRRLYIDDTSNLSDNGLVKLASFTGVDDLWLNSTRLTDAGIVHLAGMTQLKALGLATSKLTDEGLLRLSKMTKLRGLALQQTQITDRGLAALSEMKNLESLELQRTQVGDEGMKIIGRLPKLRYLSLEYTQLTDTGLTELANLKELEVLYLSGTKITDVSLKVVAEMQSLTHIWLADTKITREGAAELRRVRPRLVGTALR